MYTDTSFNNLPNGGNQCGQILFTTDNENWSCALVWNSSKIKHVVRSTLAVETLSMTDGYNIFLYNTNC